MLQKILFIAIILVIFVSGYFYFFVNGQTTVTDNNIPQTHNEHMWKESGENINLVQFDSNSYSGKKVVIKTNFGSIKIVLYPEKAPKACENFIYLAEQGFYNGLKFTQAVADYYVKAGDPQDGSGGRSMWDKPFPNELDPELWNFRGAVGMAATERNKNGSQFYIINAKTVNEHSVEKMRKSLFPEKVIEKYSEVGGAPWLDGNHTVFGQVISGLDVVDKIMGTAASKEPAVIEEIVVE